MAYENDATPQEKADVLANDKLVRERAATTLQQFATSDADTPLGRFNAVNAPEVIGTTPVIRYHAGAAWTRDDQGQEPPTGYAINDLAGDAPAPISRGRTFRRL